MTLERSPNDTDHATYRIGAPVISITHNNPMIATTTNPIIATTTNPIIATTTNPVITPKHQHTRVSTQTNELDYTNIYSSTLAHSHIYYLYILDHITQRRSLRLQTLNLGTDDGRLLHTLVRNLLVRVCGRLVLLQHIYNPNHSPSPLASSATFCSCAWIRSFSALCQMEPIDPTA